MRRVSLTDFLTSAEIDQALALWSELRGTGRFAQEVDRKIIAPVIERINMALGQENNSRFLAYLVEYTFMSIEEK